MSIQTPTEASSSGLNQDATIRRRRPIPATNEARDSDYTKKSPSSSLPSRASISTSSESLDKYTRGTPILSLPAEHDHRSPTTKLWLQSRLIPSSSPAREGVSFRTKGEERPVTMQNIRLALQLMILVWSRFLGLFWGQHKLRVVGFLAGRMVKGILPAAR